VSDSRKDGRRRGGHQQTKHWVEYWASRLHKHGETPGRYTKTLTHRLERRGKRAIKALADAELLA
jgi:hypothetical protein